MLDKTLRILSEAEVFDLGQPYRVGMPHHPFHPPFLYGMSKKHGDYTFGEGVSSASESLALGGHVGTHVDALCHFSKEGRLLGGTEAEPIQSYREGLKKHGVETIPPMLRRGVLLDAAAFEGKPILPEDYVVTAGRLEKIADKQRVEILPGDLVLIRTGWGRLWHDPKAYINDLKAPGPDEQAARWLSAKGIYAGGSDTIAFEFVPGGTMPVHVHFLVEKGIYILEALDLEGLSAAEKYEFLFIAAPLKIVGATGAPIRPLAVCC